MNFATCNEPWRDTPVEQVFKIAADIGFAGVEIAPFTIADHVDEIPAARRKEIVKAAADAGVQIVGLHWLLVSPKGLHITTPDETVRQKTVDYIRSMVNFCGDLGGKVMIHGSPGQRNVESPTTLEDAWNRARDVWAACAQTCADRGVTICVEALSTKETNFISTVEDAVKMVDEINHPNIGIMLDMKATATMPGGIIGNIEKYGARAKHFHVNEPCGKGIGMPLAHGQDANVDMKPVLAALVKSGFAGWASTEPFNYEPDPTTVARTAFSTLSAACV